jgi:hypothetical protein
MNTPNNLLLSLLSLQLVPIEGEDPSLHRLPAPYPIMSKAFWTGTAPIIGELPLHNDVTPKLDTIPRRIFTGEVATEDDDEEEATTPPTPFDGIIALACIRVSTVSIGWIANTDTPPLIQPETKSTHASSPDMVREIEE